MRRFTSLCIDKTTGAEMILYDCSYNAACMFLESENRDYKFGKFKDTERVSLHVTKLIFKKATFIYDEIRGVLMREN